MQCNGNTPGLGLGIAVRFRHLLPAGLPHLVRQGHNSMYVLSSIVGTNPPLLRHYLITRAPHKSTRLSFPW